METTTFKLANDSDKDMIIIHEPDAFDFMLPPNEELIIETESCKDSVLIGTRLVGDGRIKTSIYSEKSLYRVWYKGEDVFKKYFDDQ